MNTSPFSKNELTHIPVMLEEVIQGFAPVHIEVFYDGTVGAGGHAEALLKRHPEIKKYIACDKDPEALEIAEKTLAPWKKKIEFVQGNFADLDSHLKRNKISLVDGFFLI